jgi:hypothetical protein
MVVVTAGVRVEAKAVEKAAEMGEVREEAKEAVMAGAMGEVRGGATGAVVPGAARWFGPGAVGHLRICFSTSEGVLREGLARVVTGLTRIAGG